MYGSRKFHKIQQENNFFTYNLIHFGKDIIIDWMIGTFCGIKCDTPTMKMK